jgi:hypothetical protein
MKQIPGVIYNSALVSTLAVNSLPKHPVQVPIGGVKTNHLANKSSIALRWVRG